MVLTTQDHALRMSLYRLGLSDREIAERVYVVPMAICKWRKKCGLRPNYGRGRRKGAGAGSL